MITHKMKEILAKEEQYEQIPTKKSILLPTFFVLLWFTRVLEFCCLLCHHFTKLCKYILPTILLITFFCKHNAFNTELFKSSMDILHCQCPYYLYNQ